MDRMYFLAIVLCACTPASCPTRAPAPIQGAVVRDQAGLEYQLRLADDGDVLLIPGNTVINLQTFDTLRVYDGVKIAGGGIFSDSSGGVIILEDGALLDGVKIWGPAEIHIKPRAGKNDE